MHPPHGLHLRSVPANRSQTLIWAVAVVAVAAATVVAAVEAATTVEAAVKEPAAQVMGTTRSCNLG